MDRGVAVVHGVEMSETMLADAQRRFSDAVARGRLRLHSGRMESLPLEDSVLDAIISTNTIYFVPDLPAALTELARVLRPGGVALLRTQFADLMPDLFWYRYFPSAREVDAAMYCSVDEARALAVEAGLVPDADVVRITGEDPRTVRATYERLSLRALSTFEHLPEAETAAGFARFAEDVAQDPDRLLPVHSATMLVLRRPS